MVELKSCVRFRCLPKEFMPVLRVLLKAGEQQGFIPVITGASYEDYPQYSYHDLGYAWDVRISNVPDPLGFACQLRLELGIVDPLYRVVYGDINHTDHIHIEYRIDKAAVRTGG